MKNSDLKSFGALLYAPFLALSAVTMIAQEPSRADLLAQLIARLGPDKAAEFMARLEQKHAQESRPEQTKPVTRPVEAPVRELPAPERASQVEHTPQEQPVPAPVKRPGLDVALEDIHHFDHIIQKLETYCQGVYRCIDAFFSKRNSEPYANHIQCFKTQLQYLREELVHQFPQAQTPEAAKLFKSLETITKSLEKSQDTMCTTLDGDFVNSGMFSGGKLGIAMKGMKGMMDTQRALIDKEIGIIRNQLRAAKENDMLKKINTFYGLLNKNFDFGANRDVMDLLSILNHRVKR